MDDKKTKYQEEMQCLEQFYNWYITQHQENGLNTFELKTENISIKLGHPGAVAASSPAPITTTPSTETTSSVTQKNDITSPMVGTVFLASSPESAPFTTTGKSVSKGDTLFLIEAMKTFTPITAPYDGTVINIAVSNGQAVECEQSIMTVEPA